MPDICTVAELEAQLYDWIAADREWAHGHVQDFGSIEKCP